MKKIAALFFTVAVMLFTSDNVMAQAKAKTEITSVKQKGDNVWIKLTSSKPLIFGGNRYVLYIGDKEFMISETPSDENNCIISFLVSTDEFKTLKEGAGMYLSYGRISIDESDMPAYAEKSRRCWSLGKFSKTMQPKSSKGKTR